MRGCRSASSSFRRTRARSHGFTLIELLVVVGIIVVLIGILLPVVHKIRIAAQIADTKNWVNQLGSAIERYQQDFRAYPGPLANNEIDLADTSKTFLSGSTIFPGGFQYATATYPSGTYDVTTQDHATASGHFTMSENLVLGLLGGLYIDPTAATKTLDYDPSAVGGGPTSLNTAATTGNKRYPPYLDSRQLSWRDTSAGKTGHFQDDSGSANDTIIPEFVDRFTDPMPILYMRAKIGANATALAGAAGTFSNSYNPIITNDLAETAMDLQSTAQAAPRAGQYDTSQIIGYTGAFTGTWPSLTVDTANPPTGTSIGIGKSANGSSYTTPPSGNNLYHGLQEGTWSAPSYPSMTKGNATYVYPYSAYPYLINSSGTVRQKDGYILISAGADRVYGTEDDICNFGTVGN